LVEVSETLPLVPQLTPLMKAMEEDMMHVDSVQEKTSGPEPSGSPEQSRPSSAEPAKRVESPHVAPPPSMAETSTMTLDTFAFGPSTQPPEVPITVELPTTTAFAPQPIADPTPEDVAVPEDEIRAPSKAESESPSIRELIPTEITGTQTQDHTPLSSPESLSINEVVNVVERQSTSPSSPTNTLPQREDVLDAAILESHVVAPPRLSPPGERRLSDDWAASVLKAATASP